MLFSKKKRDPVKGKGKGFKNMATVLVHFPDAAKLRWTSHLFNEPNAIMEQRASG